MRQQRRSHFHPSYWLLPTRRNHFHPVALRPIGLLFVALVLVVTPFIYNLSTAGKPQVLGYATNITVGDLHALSNQQRTSAGIGTLTLNAKLSQAAQNKAADMFADNYWAHTAPDGTQPWTFISNAGYGYSKAGENLAKNFSTSAGVVNAWMNSASHRANLLDGAFMDVGYAAVNGTLLGDEVTLVVAMYAAPYSAPAPEPTPPPVASSTQPPAAPTPPTVTPEKAAPTPEATTPSTPVAESSESPASPAENAPTQTAPVTTSAGATETKNANTTAQTKSIEAETAGASIVALPAQAYQSLNWGQKASLVLLSVILLLFVMKHTIIWRKSKRGVRDIWLRSHPLAQGLVLAIAIILTVTTGTGTIL